MRVGAGLAVRVIAVVMLTAVLFGAVAAAAYSVSTDAAFGNVKKYDYSHPNAENVTLSGLEVASAYLEKYSDEFSEAERRFIAEYEVFTVTYSDTVTTEQVALSYDSGAGLLTVTAKSYSYGVGERRVSWYPVSAALGETELLLSDGIAVFDFYEEIV